VTDCRSFEGGSSSCGTTEQFTFLGEHDFTIRPYVDAEDDIINKV